MVKKQYEMDKIIFKMYKNILYICVS